MPLSGRPSQFFKRPWRTPVGRSFPLLKRERRLLFSLLAATFLGLAMLGATFSQAPVRAAQQVERMSVFEFVVNSVIGRSLNVPGKD